MLGNQALYITKEIVATTVLAYHQVGFSWKKSVREIWDASPIPDHKKNNFIQSITVVAEHIAVGLIRNLKTNSRSVLGIMAKKVMDGQGLISLDNMGVWSFGNVARVCWRFYS